MLSVAPAVPNQKAKLILLIILMIFLSEMASSKTYTICHDGCDFDSISEAINSASPGDILEVQSATYYENVDISKQLILIGNGTANTKPIIDAGKKGSAMIISANGVTVDGFNLTNSLGSLMNLWAGIEVNSNDNTIINNIAFNNENGILITGSNNTIQGSTIINNIYGIKSEFSTNNSIWSNILKNNYYGLFILSSRDSDIINNQAINNQYGIMLNQSVGNNLSSNEMIGNKYNFGCQRDNHVDSSNIADGKPIYYLANSKDLEIDAHQDPATVCCIDCYNITLSGLYLKNNVYGIYFDNTSHSFIEGNRLSNNSAGISLIKSYNNSIKDNQAAENIEGISITSSRYNLIYDNKALNSRTGIRMVSSDYNKAIGNFISHNANGLTLFKSGLNFIARNNLTSNSIGVDLSYSWFNSLFDNNVSSNGYGILLYLSTNNNLSRNLLNNNSKGIISDPLDDNIFNPDNKFIGNDADFENYIWKSTGAPGNPPSIAVRINSNPKGAIIIFRNDPLETPGPIYFTEPGEYNVLVKKEGYKDGNITIKIPEEISPETFPPSMRERSINLTPEWNA